MKESNPASIQSLLADLPKERASLLPALWRVFEADGVLTREALAAVGEALDVPAAEVYGVASFYALFHVEAQERAPVRVCTDVVCSLFGAQELLNALRGRREKPVYAATCLGRCDAPPAALVGRQALAPASLEGVDAVLKGVQP
ncbi:MAG: NAD(P)H-dependent oxidoreductase subunit E [Firmicutes bacterium]|nr:NAD(P)H-dependent oxidoreductase subunit E [Bacillota bacterium]